MSDDQKQKLFNAELEHYLELRQQKDSHIPSVRVIDNEKGQQQAQPETQLSDGVVVEPVPRTMRPRASCFLVRERRVMFSWANQDAHTLIFYKNIYLINFLQH